MSSYLLNYKQVDIRQFKECKKISHGGFGIIVSVEHVKTKKQFAAKIINCSKKDVNEQKMIEQEIGILINVNHPTIVKLIGYSLIDFHNEKNATIIMELAENGSLHDLIEKARRGMAPNDYNNTICQIILIGIARGMKYLHDRNIIHRDLKPNNILLDKQFYPRITDFGLSKKFEFGHSTCQCQSEIGTLIYMAPEIISNKPYNRKSDVYSFGILMFEVVTNLIPYPDLTNGAINEYDFKKNVVENNYRPEFKFEINQSLKELIERCLSDDINNRPTFQEIYEKLAFDKKYYLDNVFEDEIEEYIKEINIINDPIEDLIQKNEICEMTNKKLKKLSCKLRDENKQLKSDKSQLLKNNEELRNCNLSINNKNNELLSNLDKLRDEKQHKENEIRQKN